MIIGFPRLCKLEKSWVRGEAIHVPSPYRYCVAGSRQDRHGVLDYWLARRGSLSLRTGREEIPANLTCGMDYVGLTPVRCTIPRQPSLRGEEQSSPTSRGNGLFGILVIGILPRGWLS